MSQTPEIGPSREDRPSSELTFSRPPGSPIGTIVQETVLNPEGRRPAAGDASSSPFATDDGFPSPDSHVSKRLFPTDPDAPAVVDFDAPAGCELGHFSIEERIGSGGMGAVFRALDTRLQRVVALKVLSPAQSRDRAAVLRFQNEARAAARLDHENIARVFYFGEDRGLHFIAFEYVTGQNVRDLIARTGRLPVADAVNYAFQIAAALRHTAAAGVVHRDIKPSNIIIAPNGRAKLVDLGLARKLAADGVGELTVAGTTLGTFDYISPEQARDPRNVDVRSDIYSLGCTLYHMLTGSPPYSSGTVLQKLLDHQSGQAPDPRTVNAQVPPALSAICRKMMAGDPRNRYATPDELIRDLAQVAAGLGLRPLPADYVWARPPAAPAPKVRPGVIWGGSAAVVVLLAILVDQWPSAVDPEPPTRPSQATAAVMAGPPVRLAEGPSPSEDNSESLPPVQYEPDYDAVRPAGDIPGDHAADQDGIAAPGIRRTEVASTGVSGSEASSVPSAAEVDMGVGTPMSGALGRSGERSAADALTYEEIEQQYGNFAQIWGQFFKAVLPEPESPEPAVAPPIDVADPLHFVPTKPFVLRSPDGESNEYRSLAEAVLNAYSGDTIELHFDGRPAEAATIDPLVIDGKSITIKAGAAPDDRPYRPLIEFLADRRSDGRSQMIVVSGDDGGLALEGVELRMTVSGETRGASDQWALFGMTSTEQIRLQDVAVTLVNPKAYPLSVFDLRPPEGVSREAYKLMGMRDESRADGFLVELERCFVRGGADLVTIAHAQPGRIAVRDSALVLEQTALLNVTGGLEEPPAGDAVDVEFDHVTAMLGGSVLQVAVGELPRHVATVRVEARDSVFACSNVAGPLVLMTGSATPEAFEQALVWDGRNNVFDGFSQFWSVYTTEDGALDSFTGDGAADPVPTTFELWQAHWSGVGPIDPDAAEHAVSPDQMLTNIWAHPQAAKNKSRPEVTAEDLALDADDVVDLVGDEDTDIGTSPDELPPVSTPPGGLSTAGRSAS